MLYQGEALGSLGLGPSVRGAHLAFLREGVSWALEAWLGVHVFVLAGKSQWLDFFFFFLISFLSCVVLRI